MASMSIREVRRRLSEVITAVEHGSQVVITRRGRKVAVLSRAAARVRRKLPDLQAFRSSIALRGKALSTIVSESRSEGRG